MHQIAGQLQKLSQKKSTQWVGPVILAILVHFLLLVIFRPMPPVVAKEYNELSSITVLELASLTDSQLPQWLENHDPARLLRPDPVS